ncbi:FHA domain-containing protein [Leptolyngbya sp. CCNP1308]|uniref:FHA domain-containing protein n=1 Tax=Leptolyngbya sp. CCNP1308 TaxID=3110255 RepID=UPI002B1F5FAF|nr:FHA domain-containing protein [Leptolyngbya sp. CCNP1308]MEA5448355.1 FHA domain-containing protein [Leptolyngbya sp. CCNP1308]
MTESAVPKLTLYFPDEFGDVLWRGETFALEAPKERGTVEWLLGRSPASDLTITIRTVSRRHAAIAYSYAANRWSISDLGSALGTYVNGQKLEEKPHVIGIGDKFYLGTPEARIHCVEDAQDTISPDEQGPETIASTSPLATMPPPPPPPPPAPAPATNADNINFALQWLATPTTWLGGIVRFVVAALVALVVVLVFDN